MTYLFFIPHIYSISVSWLFNHPQNSQTIIFSSQPLPELRLLSSLTWIPATVPSFVSQTLKLSHSIFWIVSFQKMYLIISCFCLTFCGRMLSGNPLFSHWSSNALMELTNHFLMEPPQFSSFSRLKWFYFLEHIIFLWILGFSPTVLLILNTYFFNLLWLSFTNSLGHFFLAKHVLDF